MAENENGTLRTVAWREILPWLIIFRSFRLARSIPVLLLAAAAVFLTLSGWSLLYLAFQRDPQRKEWMDKWMGPHADCPWVAITNMVPDEPTLPGLPALRGSDGPVSAPETTEQETEKPASPGESEPAKPDRPYTLAAEPADPVFGTWAKLTRPVWEAFTLRTTFPGGVLVLLLGGLWSLAVWAFFGGAISRIAAVQLASEERVGLMAAIRFAGSRWFSYFSAPLFPLIGISLATFMVLLGAWLLNFPLGVFLASLGWLVALLAGLLMGVLLLGLVFGWPLMWATISAEGTDNFSALSNSYNYAFGRPLHYLFYAVVAALFGGLSWLLVKNFAAGIIWLSYWAASWGCGGDQIKLLMPGGGDLEGLTYAGAVVIHFWTGCVKLAAVAFVYGYFWSAVTAIYFLLRRDVDATEMDEVFLDEDASEQAYGLPPLKLDESGAPLVPDQEGDAGEQDGAESQQQE